MSTMLLVDSSIAFREELSRQLRDVGYDVAIASSAPQAIDSLARHMPKGMIVDIDLPTIDGMELIRHVRSRGHLLRIPIVILTNNTDPKKILESARLRVQAFLSKRDHDFGDFLARLVSATGEAPPAQILFPALGTEFARVAKSKTVNPQVAKDDGQMPRVSLDKFLQKVSTKAFKPEAVRLLERCNSPDVSLSELEACVRDSPALVAEILRTANSAAFSPNHKKVGSLGDAIGRMGIDQVRVVVSNSFVESQLLSAMQEEVGWRMWQNGLACGRIMECLRPSGTNQGMDYLLGICTSLVPLTVCQHLGSDLEQVKRVVDKRKEMSDSILEELFGIPGEDVTQAILEKIGLPANIVQPLVESSRHNLGHGKGTADAISLAINLSRRLANAMFFAISPYAMIKPLTLAEWNQVPNIAGLIERWSSIRSDVLLKSFEIAQDSHVVRQLLTSPFFTRNESIRVELRCGQAFAKFGPIRLFLSGICQVVDPEWDGVESSNALVLVGDEPESLLNPGDSGKPILILHSKAAGSLASGLPNSTMMAHPCTMDAFANAVHALRLE